MQDDAAQFRRCDRVDRGHEDFSERFGAGCGWPEGSTGSHNQTVPVTSLPRCQTKLNATPASQESVEELKLVVEGFQALD